MKHAYRTLCAIGLCLAAPCALAAPGDLDPTFGTNGEVALTNLEGTVTDVLVRYDGKVLVLVDLDNLGEACAVARLNANGSIDTSFNGNGRVILSYGATQDCVKLIQLPNLKLVVLSNSEAGNNSTGILTAVQESGPRDTTWGANGRLLAENVGPGGKWSSITVTSGGVGYLVGASDRVYRLADVSTGNGLSFVSASAVWVANADAPGIYWARDTGLLTSGEGIVKQTTTATVGNANYTSWVNGASELREGSDVTRDALGQWLIAGAITTISGLDWNISHVHGYAVDGTPLTSYTFQAGPVTAVIGASLVFRRGLSSGQFYGGGRDFSIATTMLGRATISARSVDSSGASLAQLMMRDDRGRLYEFLPDNFGSAGAVNVTASRGSFRASTALAVTAQDQYLVGGSSYVTPAPGQPVGTQYPTLLAVQGLNTPALRLDLDPDGFDFGPTLDDVGRGEWIQAPTLTVSGLGAGVEVPVWLESTAGEFRVNGSAWARYPETVRNGDRVELRLLSSLIPLTPTGAQLCLGGVRAENDYASAIGPKRCASFFATTAAPLPGTRCSQSLGSNCNATIPDYFGPFTPVLDSTLNSIGSTCFVNDIEVGVDLSHPRVGDLTAILIAPDGTRSTLFERIGTNTAGDCDEADVLASFANDPLLPRATFVCGREGSSRALDGRYQAKDGLASFLGRAGIGVWTLRVFDSATGEAGQLNDWSLRLGCQATAPAIADIRVTREANSDARAVAGAPYRAYYRITNHGPSSANNIRLNAELPVDPTNGWSYFSQAQWACSSPSGSCTMTTGLGNGFVSGLSLAPGAFAEIALDATPGAWLLNTELVDISLRTSLVPIIFQTNPVDPDASNNELLDRQFVQNEVDVRLEASASRSNNEIELNAAVYNEGPSDANEIRVQVRFPGSYFSISQVECLRNDLQPCGGNVDHSVPLQRTFSGIPMRVGSAPLRIRVRGVFLGAAPPNDTIFVDAVPAGQVDPNAANHTLNVLPSGQITDLIFRSSF